MKGFIFPPVLLVALMIGSCSSGNKNDKDWQREGKPWEMQSVFPTKLKLFGESGVRIQREINRYLKGVLKLELHEPGELVPTAEVFDAVARGDITIAFTRALYAAPKYPSAVFFDSVPFGASGMDQYRWLKSKEGRQLFNELMEGRYGVKALPCALVGSAGGGWFKKPINNALDPVGWKLRFLGLGGKVAEKLGTTLVPMSRKDVYAALENESIDGAVFANPVIDMNLEFWKTAKNYYYPSWHARTTLSILVINPYAWDSLGIEAQRLFENVCQDNVIHWLQQSQEMDQRALTEMKEKGAIVRSFPEAVVVAAQEAWLEVDDDISKTDPLFRKTSDAYQRFLARRR